MLYAPTYGGGSLFGWSKNTGTRRKVDPAKRKRKIKISKLSRRKNR